MKNYLRELHGAVVFCKKALVCAGFHNHLMISSAFKLGV